MLCEINSRQKRTGLFENTCTKFANALKYLIAFNLYSVTRKGDQVYKPIPPFSELKVWNCSAIIKNKSYRFFMSVNSLNFVNYYNIII
jgi:hypothetical protein